MSPRLRAVLFSAVWVVAVGLLLWGQTTRETYRDTYRVWRQTDPSLERDAATTGTSLAVRADLVAARAAKFGVDRHAILDQHARESEPK